MSFSQTLSDLSAIDQISFVASFFDCKEAFLGQESEMIQEILWMFHCLKSRDFSGEHGFCIILADKQNCSDTDEYFLLDRSKI